MFLSSRGGGRGGRHGTGYGPLGPVIKGVAGGIGLASESIHHYKENKAAKKASLSRENSDSSLPPPPSYDELEAKRSTSKDDVGIECTEKHEGKDEVEKEWELDEAQDEFAELDEQELDQNRDQKPAKRKQEGDPKKMVQTFTDLYPAPVTVEQGALSLPVILPQRRPKDRTRGFIRAYAPELQKCGIDEPMFSDFLDTFNAATQASPWLDAINLASFAFMVLPTAIGQAASMALAIAVDITKNMQSRHRHGYVLDQMNNDFYRPRGLYALVLTWNPAVDDLSIGVNINETIGKNIRQPQGIVDKTKKSFRPSMGNTNGVVFSETAPLVFPALQQSLTESTHQETKTKREKIGLVKNLVADYYDRRAQAQYAGENPDSDLLVTPKPKFTSRYSDPNHPASSGSLIGLVTGGAINIPPKGQRIAAVRSWSDQRSRARNGYSEQTGQELEYGYGRRGMSSRNNSGGPVSLLDMTVGRVLRKVSSLQDPLYA